MNIEQMDYESLAEEASAEEAHPWNPDDWDPEAQLNASRFAKKNGLPWPPTINCFDNWYDQQHN